MSTKLPTVSIENLLNAGVHFGHKKYRWNPEMAPYIYGVDKNTGMHILNVKQTVQLLRRAMVLVYNTAKRNGKILFVGTKPQISDVVADYASACGQFYINHSWMGGLLTNWNEVFDSNIKSLEYIENILADDKRRVKYTKKEIAGFERNRKKLAKGYDGIRKMGGKPDLIVVLDTSKEALAVREAVRLGIPIIAILDSNSDPRGINVPIPGNDDAIRAVSLYLEKLSTAALLGKNDAKSRAVNEKTGKNAESQKGDINESSSAGYSSDRKGRHNTPYRSNAKHDRPFARRDAGDAKDGGANNTAKDARARYNSSALGKSKTHDVKSDNRDVRGADNAVSNTSRIDNRTHDKKAHDGDNQQSDNVKKNWSANPIRNRGNVNSRSNSGNFKSDPSSLKSDSSNQKNANNSGSRQGVAWSRPDMINARATSNLFRSNARSFTGNFKQDIATSRSGGTNPKSNTSDVANTSGSANASGANPKSNTSSSTTASVTNQKPNQENLAHSSDKATSSHGVNVKKGKSSNAFVKNASTDKSARDTDGFRATTSTSRSVAVDDVKTSNNQNNNSKKNDNITSDAGPADTE